ncbi:pentapeptide repeat-containing protein [Mycobacterium sp.]|uniref:pentapeptide repeat-containing protein n=1 Tax=Mycobacterium sp. TaxID=1785 RepID=UPI0034137344
MVPEGAEERNNNDVRWFWRAWFRWPGIRWARFRWARLWRSRLRWARFRWARFRWARLWWSRLRRARWQTRQASSEACGLRHGGAAARWPGRRRADRATGDRRDRRRIHASAGRG